MRRFSRLLRLLDENVERLLRQFNSALSAESHHSLTLRLSILLAVLHGATTPASTVVVRTVGLLMLLLPALASQAAMWWWIVVVAVIVSNAEQWELIDNHQFLIAYWLLACCLSLKAPLRLQTNARLLVAVAFVSAVTWKLMAGEYLDGGFFYSAFLTDGRLQKVAGAISPEGLEGVRHAGRAIAQLSALGVEGSVISISTNGRLTATAIALSWAGLLIEAAVGLLHLVPGERWYLARHAALMAFVGFTYVLLPVVGFGFVLAVMGFAQVSPGDERLKRLYLVLLCFLQVSLVPWRDLLPG